VRGNPSSRSSFGTLADIEMAARRRSDHARLEAHLLSEVSRLDASSKRQMLRLLHNAKHDLEDDQSEHTSLAAHLAALGQEREFEVFDHNVEQLKSFDLLLFRGSDFVSDFIIKLTRKFRGVEFFTHVGLVLQPPLIPKDGHYLKGGAVESGQKMLPFVQVRLELGSHQQLRGSGPYHPGGTELAQRAHTLVVTVLKCRGLPARLDHGGCKEDPFVRVALTPYDHSAGQAHRTATIHHAGHNPNFRSSDQNAITLSLPPPPHPRPPALQIEVWDEDRTSPADLIGFHNLAVDDDLLRSMAVRRGAKRWLLLRLVDELAHHTIYGMIQPPQRLARQSAEQQFVLASQRHSLRTLALRADSSMVGADGELALPPPDRSAAAAASRPPVPPREKLEAASQTEQHPLCGNLLMAPMGLHYNALYAEELERKLPWRRYVLAQMNTWKYFFYILLLLLVTLFCFEIKLTYQKTSGYMVDVSASNMSDSTTLSRADTAGGDGWYRQEGSTSEWFRNHLVEPLDWLIVVCFTADIALRLACHIEKETVTELAEFTSNSWNRLDVLLTVCDVTVHIVEYSLHVEFGEDDLRGGWNWLFVLQLLRNLRVLRAVRLVQVWRAIWAAKRHTWGLHSVHMTRTDRGIEVQWSNVLLKAGASVEDASLEAPSSGGRHSRGRQGGDAGGRVHTFGPLLIGVDPASPFAPASILDKFEHIQLLKRQSDFCFKLPAHSLEAPPQFVGYLQFDPMKKDVRDAWISDINAEFKRLCEESPTHPTALEAVVAHRELTTPKLIAGDDDHVATPSKPNAAAHDNVVAATSHSRVGHYRDFLEAADKLRGATDRVMGTLEAKAGQFGTRVAHTGAELQQLLLHRPQLFSKKKKATSESVRREVILREKYEDGTPVTYVWEATASGSIAGCPDALSEETHSAELAVQIRKLNAVIDSYDGEIAAMTLVGAAESGDDHVARAAAGELGAEAAAQVQQQLTRLHEKFYLRKYEVNIFHQLSALYPWAKKWSRCCDILCCRGCKGSESLFCSQFCAEVYQGMGQMSPEVDAGTVRDRAHTTGTPGIAPSVPLEARPDTHVLCGRGARFCRWISCHRSGCPASRSLTPRSCRSRCAKHPASTCSRTRRRRRHSSAGTSRPAGS
jgi:hypothetical protein